ncbi:hypothetical protein [Embleya sp. AB8]|uniref:hypothetical protein n=1 Tax=Embleya sp. AB8 TaxID=3156304 RepID=UPI003C733568
MDTDEYEGVLLLAALREAPHIGTDEPGVNLARAIRDGRRAVLLRRAIAVTAGAVAVALVALVAAVIAAPGHHDRPGPASGHAFDVRERAFRVGSAGGFTPLSYETGRYRQRVVLGPERVDAAAGSVATPASVTMYAPSRPPTPDPAARPVAPPVHDRPAAWLIGPDPGGGRLELAWQWAPGAWAIATMVGPAADAERIHQIAESVQPGARLPVTGPLSLPEGALRTGEHLIAVVTPMGADRSTRYALRFGTTDPPAPDGTEPPSFTIGVGAPPLGEPGPLPDRITRPDGTFAESQPAIDAGRLRALLSATTVTGNHQTTGTPSIPPTLPPVSTTASSTSLPTTRAPTTGSPTSSWGGPTPQGR